MSFDLLRSVCAAAFVAALLVPGLAGAQQYPSQPIRIIVPNPAGGLPDTLSRIVGKRLQERIGQPVVIENRPLESPDGAVLSISPLIYLKLPYNPKDIMPAAFVARAPIWLAANQKVPVTNMKEFAAYAKSKGGQATYGTSGVGSFHHLSMEAVQSGLNVKLNVAP